MKNTNQNFIYSIAEAITSTKYRHVYLVKDSTRENAFEKLSLLENRDFMYDQLVHNNAKIKNDNESHYFE